MESDLYESAGGDIAWRKWFELCSVGRVQAVDPNLASGLRKQIESAMRGQVKNMGLDCGDICRDDAVSHFDSFFLLESGRKEKSGAKPLKQYYKYRMSLNDRPLKQFVCGTLFSAQCGRIRDIARDWVATVRGWKPHSLTQSDGKRVVVWESAAAKEDIREVERTISYKFGSRLDGEALKKYVQDMLVSVASQLGVEKSVIALLFYVTAQKISVATPTVVEKLGVEKSRAYKLRDKCMNFAEEFFKEKDIATDDIQFARILLKTCEQCAGEEIVTKLQD